MDKEQKKISPNIKILCNFTNKSDTVKALDKIANTIGAPCKKGMDGNELGPCQYYSQVVRYRPSSQALIRQLLLALVGSHSNVFNGSPFPTLASETITFKQQVARLPGPGITMKFTSENAPSYCPNATRLIKSKGKKKAKAPVSNRTVVIPQPVLLQLGNSARIFTSPLLFDNDFEFMDVCKFADKGLSDDDEQALCLTGEQKSLLSCLQSQTRGAAGTSLQAPLDSVISTIGKLDTNSKTSLGLDASTSSITLATLATGVAIRTDVLFLVKQFADSSEEDSLPQALPQVINGTVSFDKHKPVTVISIAGVDGNTQPETTSAENSSCLWFKLFLNMWATALTSAQERGCRILCFPLEELESMGPEDSMREFLTVNLLALGILLKTAFENTFDRVYIGHSESAEVIDAWNVVFGEESGALNSTLVDNGGPLLLFSNDMMFLAESLAYANNLVAYLSVCSAQTTYGLCPLGGQALNLDKRTQNQPMSTQTRLGLFSTIMLASRGLGMSTVDRTVASIYEDPNKIILLKGTNFDPIFQRVSSIISKTTPEACGMWFAKANASDQAATIFTENNQDKLESLNQCIGYLTSV